MFVAEINDDAWVNSSTLRFEADKRMRQRLETMGATCPFPRLWGLSLFGTSLRVYSCDVATGELEPPFVDRPTPRRYLPSNFLDGAWNIDLLSHEGFTKMREIVEDIEHMIANAPVPETA